MVEGSLHRISTIMDPSLNGGTTNDQSASSSAIRVTEKPNVQPTDSSSSSTLGLAPEDTREKDIDIEAKAGAQPTTDDIFWDEPVEQDPANPMNWNERRKWGNIFTVSAITFLVPLGSSMFAPGVPEVMYQFHSTNQELASFVVSIYILGFALGPLVLAPLSEMYGRVPLYHVTNVLFLCFNIACAKSSSLGMLVAFRLLAGCFGAAPLTIGAGTVADLMPTDRRGAALAIFALGPLVGPVIGPIAGGFLVNAKGWRWVFWILSIAGGAMILVCAYMLEETYAPVILDRKVARLRKETGNPMLRSKLSKDLTKREIFRTSIVRPLKLLLTSPICLLLSIYNAIAYGVLYLLFTTFTFVFEEKYHFSTSIVGLAYLGIGIGTLVMMGINGVSSDRILRGIEAKGGIVRPEDRLHYLITIPGAICLPLGLFIYGWTADKQVHWIVPILGTGFVGAGICACMFCVQNYLIDAFTLYAASAIAANTVLRSLFGAVLPVAGLRMNSALGLGWSNSLLAFVAIAMIPLPIFFRIKGQSIRTNPNWQVSL